MPVVPPWIPGLFHAAAVVNWLGTATALVWPEAAFVALDLEPPRYPSLVRVLAGTAFMFGFVLWEVGRFPLERAFLAKYAWLAKSIVFLGVVIGALGDTPATLLAIVAVTDGVWIPPLLYADYVLRQELDFG